MSEQIVTPSADFDQNITNQASDIEEATITLTGIAIGMANTYRVPRYSPERRENNAEHSHMLGLVCAEIRARFFNGLDAGLVAEFCDAHDLLELITGDVATFNISEEEFAQKNQNEHDNLELMCSSLPPHTAHLLRRYEQQQEPEARFVRFVDKLLPVAVNIVASTGSQIMQEDYDTHTKEGLIEAENRLKQRFLNMFPEEELKPLHIARDGLAAQFELKFKPNPQYALF